MALTKVSGEVIKRPLILTSDASISGIMTVGTGSTTTTIDGSFEYPTFRPTLDLNFAATKTLDRRITFTRDSLGTYTDELGIIRTAPNNTPRFDHDPVTGESLGLLIEESRTNILEYSNPDVTSYWGNPTWSTEDGTVTDDAATAPDGTTTARQYTFGATTSWVQIRKSLNVTGDHTISVFAKKVSSGDSLTVTNTSTGDTPISSGTEQYPNEWVRYWFSTTNITQLRIQFNVDVYIWGVQVEAGSFPTSYIPTSGSTVTRAADIAKITGTNFTSFYRSEEFTLYGDGRSITGSSDVDGNPAMVSIDDNTNSNRFILRRWDPGGATPRSGFTFRYYRTDISLNLDAFPHATTGYDATGDMPDWQDALLHKMAFAVNNNSQVPHDIAGYGDGYSADFGVTTPGGYTGTETLTPYTAATQMQIGFGASSARWNGHISSIKYYPKRLSNAQLKGLTSQ